MKRSILLILGFLAGIIPAFAQMSADSTTVQIIAYWKVGDKYNYQVEETQYKILNGTDTTDVMRSAHLVTYEIVDATDSTYRVRVKTDDYQHSNYETAAIVDEVTELFGNMPFEFETNQYGAFKRLIISDDDLQRYYKEMEAILERMTAGKGLTDEVREATMSMVRDIFTKEKIEQIYIAEFKPLIQFHGLWMKIGVEVPYETEAPSLFGDGENIKMNGRFWADEELTDDYSVVIREEEVVDEGDMQKLVLAVINKTLGALASSIDEENMEEARKEIDSVIGSMKIEVNTSIFEEIHLDTGWPLYFEFEKDSVVKVEDMEQRQVQFQSVSILLDDED